MNDRHCTVDLLSLYCQIQYSDVPLECPSFIVGGRSLGYPPPQRTSSEVLLTVVLSSSGFHQHEQTLYAEWIWRAGYEWKLVDGRKVDCQITYSQLQ